MSLVDFIERRLPGWMRKPRYIQWLRLAEAISLTFDVLVEGLYEGRLASMPGQIDAPDLGGFGSVDALPYTGRDRRIRRGLDETIPQYAQRLRGWRTIHREAGTDVGLLKRLQEILRIDPPRVRVVSALGRWWSREAGEGAFTFNTELGDGFTLPATGIVPAGGGALESGIAHPWNFGGDAAEIYPIIYGPVPRIGVGLTLGDVALILGDTSQTVGTTATPATVEAVRAEVNQSRPAGMLPRRIIIAFDAASFDPLGAPGDPGYPDDGDWLLGTKIEIDDEGGYARVPVRLDTARYWIGKEPDEIV
jgi:hypothetical protein